MGECGILAFGGAWIPIARRRVGLRLSILSYLHHALSRLVDSTAPAEERPLQLYRIHAGCEGPGAAAVTSAPPSGPLLACSERSTSRYHSVEIHPWSFTRSCLIGLIFNYDARRWRTNTTTTTTTNFTSNNRRIGKLAIGRCSAYGTQSTPWHHG